MTQFALPAAVNFDNFRDVRARGQSHVDASSQRADFDLSGLEECNSAAAALLLAWLRYAHAHGKSVVYAGAPVGLRDILEVSGLRDVLPLGKL